MRCLKKLGVLAVLALALGAFGPTNASAARFTYNPLGGELIGHDLTNHVLTVNGGKVECNTAEAFGSIVEISPEKQHYTIDYRECKAFGVSTVDVTQGTYLFTANGQIHLQSTFKVVVTVLGTPTCSLEIKPQTIKSVDYAGGTKLFVNFTLTGFTYTSSGGLCGSSGANGTYSGSLEIERRGHQSKEEWIHFDP